MATLTYWVSQCLNDSEAYNIREKTKKEVVRVLTEVREMELKDTFEDYDNTKPCQEYWSGEPGNRVRYSVPHKVTVHYADAMDLLKNCLGEGGVYEGPNQT